MDRNSPAKLLLASVDKIQDQFVIAQMPIEDAVLVALSPTRRGGTEKGGG
jgi:hypothetical protein